jgi:glycerol uptake facilitator-like aquaporin
MNELLDNILMFINGAFGASLMLLFGIAAIVLITFGNKHNRKIRWIFCGLCLAFSVSFFCDRSLISSWSENDVGRFE